jgi:antitoxin ParD1/3/4
MNVSLSPELEKWVQEKVESGLYQTASEVVREALRGQREREDQAQWTAAELRRLVSRSLTQMDVPGGVAFDEAAVGEIERRGRARIDEAAG